MGPKEGQARTAAYDTSLQVEACALRGIARRFPAHFHEYCVIGLVLEGQRRLSCRGAEHVVGAGDVLMFDAGDSHACVQNDQGSLHYLSLHISPRTLASLTWDDPARGAPVPHFTANRTGDADVRRRFLLAHDAFMGASAHPAAQAEEALRDLLAVLVDDGLLVRQEGPSLSDGWIESLCRYMREHLTERIRLDDLCRIALVSKSTLLREFVRAKGVTPYVYLENVRVEHAQRLLRQGSPPAEAAAASGFYDQSHFTNYFTSFIGLTPSTYRAMFTTAGKEPHA